MRDAFEVNQGRIVEEYYALNFRAALLLVAKSPPTPKGDDRAAVNGTADGKDVEYKTRLFYDPSESTPAFDDVFRSARRVERQYSVLLRGQSQEILAQGIYTTGAHLLSVLDAMIPGGRGSEQLGRVASAVGSAKKETRQIEHYAHGAAMKSALVRYLLGIFFGAVVAGLGVVLMKALPLRFEIGSQLTVCLACGGIGAIVSVMVRITNRERVQVGFDQGALVTILSGGFRPIIGAVFGAILFVLVAGGLLPIATPGQAEKLTLFFAGLAFLAGFSERWAQDTIVRSIPGIADPGAPPIAEADQVKDG